MNLDELQSVQSRERQASSLQHLRASFYEDAGEYIGELRRERNQTAAAADDPFDSPEVERLTDDIRTAERTVESIYERRVGKVVKLASIAAADMPYDDDGLTSEEEALFAELVDAIEHNREHVLSVLDGEAPSLDCTPADRTESAATTDSTGTKEQPGAADPTPPSDAREEDPSMGVETDPATGTAPDSDSAADDRPTPPDRPVTAGEDPSSATGTHGEEPARAPADAAGGANAADGANAAGGVDAADDALDIGGAMGGGSRDDGGRSPSRGSDPATTADSQTADATETPTPEPAEPASERPAAPTRARNEDGDGDHEPIERTTIRITADVGDIFGVDGRSYDLSAEDVVTLPTPNAEGLVSKDAAERLD